ncbi:TetR/AcrR family transcriptional regulator [Sphingomonas naphthae]|uniref:TetR/AcrR family transcriptional regulator n=1 Tax=Sphingomonas naphthae TaxID=1813468 RepID=A0ABY7TMI5_9SPHN|nr:TetR/AcrR family transcriptional regulator [Sphingomonas naphthae]WCT74435.1 TetR/AcrR family transcriptional regulator [Sphingomonas naphthae]
MAATRRVGDEGSATRTALLDAAQQLMCDKGYAAVTSRQLAAVAGLKPQLVHYYFRTMDDLFLALFHRVAEDLADRQMAVLDADDPLEALWEMSRTATSSALSIEFVAMANHRKVLKAAIADFGEAYRKRQSVLLSGMLKARGIDTAQWPAPAVAFIIESLTRCMGFEEALGMSGGHAQTLAIVRDLIAGPARAARRRSKASAPIDA